MTAKRKGKTKPRRSRGALTALACLLILSAFVRLSDQAGQAIAKTTKEEAPPPPPMSHPEPSPDIQAVLAALADREARVAETERQVKLRMMALEEADIDIQNRLNELRAAENALRETLALADQAAENDLAKLTAVYENMKPKEAAKLFETMEPSFAAGFLGRMKPAAAAGIMAGLSPEVAYSISVMLAGRNAEVPTE